MHGSDAKFEIFGVLHDSMVGHRVGLLHGGSCITVTAKVTTCIIVTSFEENIVLRDLFDLW